MHTLTIGSSSACREDTGRKPEGLKEKERLACRRWQTARGIFVPEVRAIHELALQVRARTEVGVLN